MNFSLMSRVKSHIKTHTVKTNAQEEQDAFGGLINSDGEELEWDPGSSSEWIYFCFLNE